MPCSCAFHDLRLVALFMHERNIEKGVRRFNVVAKQYNRRVIGTTEYVYSTTVGGLSDVSLYWAAMSSHALGGNVEPQWGLIAIPEICGQGFCAKFFLGGGFAKFWGVMAPDTPRSTSCGYGL